jgi:general secretion pathway protein N
MLYTISVDRRRRIDGEKRVSALPESPARARDDLIRGCSILGLVLGAVAFGHSLQSALAATAPVDGAAIETTINPRIADPTPAASRSDKPAARTLTGNPLWAIPLKSLTSTRERPLFSPSRRPPPAAAVAASPAPAPPPPKPAEPDHPPLTLVGTVVGETQSIGVFVDQVTKNVIRLRTGEGHAGWTLRAIQGREATFEKDQLVANLALPARSAMVAASVTPPSPVAAQPGNARLDGGGQPITPPLSPLMQADGKPRVVPPSMWVDGDGQSIGPPPSPKMAEDGKPLGPAVWLDGYGRPIGPAPTVWQDGDGQSINPPPYPWLDTDGNPVVPPARAWQDGDGQLISPPAEPN